MKEHGADLVVIGGGFYGCYLAAHEATRGRRVVLLEAGETPMQLASKVNQARIHNGYHYPRSVLTALRSRESYERFTAEFAKAVCADFTHHYAIARHGSNVTPQQFALFCERIGAGLTEVTTAGHFDPTMVDAVFRVKEAAFDAIALRDVMLERMRVAGVELLCGTRALRIAKASGGLCVEASNGSRYTAPRVLNCTYAAMNDVLAASSLPGVPLKLELVEILLLHLPPALQGLGWTIMDGPFWGCLPFPAFQASSLYHVRYSVHGSWQDEGSASFRPDVQRPGLERVSAATHMLKDAARYVPRIADSGRAGSAWVIRAKLPGSARTDSRPILFVPCPTATGLFHIMGGKIDNVYDVLPILDEALGQA